MESRVEAAIGEVCESVARGGTELLRAADSFMALHVHGAIWEAACENGGCADTHWRKLVRTYFALPARVSAILDSDQWFFVTFAKSLALLLPFTVTPRVLALVAHAQSCGTRGLWAAAVRSKWDAADIRQLIESLPTHAREAFAVDVMCDAVLGHGVSSASDIAKACIPSDSHALFRLLSSVPISAARLLVSEHNLTLSSDTDQLLAPALEWFVRDASPISLVLGQATALMYLLGRTRKLSDTQASSLSRGVQCRLDRLDADVSLVGQVVAEGFAAVLERPLVFEYAAEHSAFVAALRGAFALGREDAGLSPVQCFVAPEPDEDVPVDEQPVGEPVILATSDAPKGAALMSAALCDSHEVPRNARLRPPRFLRDAFAHIKSGDYPRVECGLAALPLLISAPGQTLLARELGADMLEAVLCVSTGEDSVSHDALRRGALVALVHGAHAALGHCAVRLLRDSQSVCLQQRIELVTALIAALRADSNAGAIGASETSALDALDREMGIEPITFVGVDLRMIVQNVVIPILSIGSSERIFRHADGMLLEKTLFLAAAACGHGASGFDAAALAFIAPVADSVSLQPLENRPVSRAFAFAAHRIACSFSASPLAHAPEIARIGAALRAVVERGGDDDAAVYAARACIEIEERVAPAHRLLSEAANAMAITDDALCLSMQKAPSRPHTIDTLRLS